MQGVLYPLGGQCEAVGAVRFGKHVGGEVSIVGEGCWVEDKRDERDGRQLQYRRATDLKDVED